IGCAWVLEEALRDRVPFGGFPWGRLAFSQESSPLRWFVMLGGAPLLSFVVAVAGGALAMAALNVRSPRGWSFLGAVTTVLVLLVAGYVWGAVLPAPSSRHTLRIAAVHGSVPHPGVAFEDPAPQGLDDHLAPTLQLAAHI